MRRFLLILLSLTLPLLTTFAAPPPLTPEEPRVAIRQQILAWTPPGTAADEVLKRIRAEFHPREGAAPPMVEPHPARGAAAERSGHPGAQCIRLVLGHYFATPQLLMLPNPLVATTTTTVQWAFDAEGKLLDVFVDKDVELGDEKPPTQ